jgi:hypothetical protein
MTTWEQNAMSSMTQQSLTDERDEWYTTQELAALLRVDASTIRRWRTGYPRQGPAFIRISGGVTRYHRRDVQRWLDSRRIDPEGTQGER